MWPSLFVNPLLLGGLALASIPIIIHILNKRRFTVHHWAAMDFLFKASIMNRRRVRLEDLLLLLLRVALILLLVMTLARPLIQGLGEWSEDRRLIVLDDSYSVDVQTPTGSLFSVARDSVENQVQDAVGRSLPVDVQLGSRPDAVGLRGDPSPAADDPATAPSEPPRNVAQASWELIDAVRGVQPADRPLQLARILDRIAEEMTEEESKNRRIVTLVSDFRRGDWLQDASDELRPELRAALERLRDENLTSQLGFLLVNLGRPSRENVAIIDVHVVSDHPTIGRPVKIRVEAHNFGSAPRRLETAELEIGRGSESTFEPFRRLELPVVDRIEAGESATVEVETRFDEAGTYLLRARREADRLPRDDESYAIVTVREGIETLIVDGDPGAGRFAGESDYLLAALAPRGELASGVEARVITGAVSESELEDVDVLCLLNRRPPRGEELEAVQSFVDSGGGLVWFLGNQVEPDAYELLAAPRQQGDVTLPGIFPARLREPLRREEPVALVPRSLEHPAFAVFAGLEGSPLETPLFRSFRQLEPVEGALAAAHFGDADRTPGIVELAVEDGAVALFNTTADRDASDWPTHPSFVIVAQEWVRHLAPRRDAHRNLTVGDAIRWKKKPGYRYTIVRPDGERIPAAAPGGDVAEELAFEDTFEAGFYRLEESWAATAMSSNEDSSPGVSWFACKRPESESDLTPLEEDRLRSVLDEYGVRYSLGKNIDVDAFANEQEGEIWKWLALAAAGILLLELAAAWWFGRR